MCCFSQSVEQVSNTNVFARSTNGKQFLVYSMAYAAAEDLAMVLPLPVSPHRAEDAVRFINLERYPSFFNRMKLSFINFDELTLSLARGPAVAEGPLLQVHQLGSFEASFVPQLDDFDRLDAGFRIPRGVWDRLPEYHDYGFAVFKLKGDKPIEPQSLSRLEYLRAKFRRKPPDPAPTPRLVHPMAFEFPRRNREVLYFPTLHVHDRSVHLSAQFDHILYCQPDPGMKEYLEGWEEAFVAPTRTMEIDLTEGIVDPHVRCWRRSLVGMLENRDTLVGRGGAVPAAC
jgi:hypothetical protein